MINTEENKKPLRQFHGIGFYKSDIDNYEGGFKICCSPHDKNGNSLEVDEDKIFDVSNHDKSFLFEKFSGNIKISQIHYFGKWEEYEFGGAPHYAWVPIKEDIDSSKKEQRRAFQIFKDLIVECEKINGFPITDERHDLFSKPKYRSLLIRILNSKKYLSTDTKE
jgi:hypothetical protein